MSIKFLRLTLAVSPSTWTCELEWMVHEEGTYLNSVHVSLAKDLSRDLAIEDSIKST